MKKYIRLILTSVFAIIATVEVSAQATKNDWYNCSHEVDGLYGAEVDKAYEFLGRKKAKHKPVVAIIGYGIDIEHEALAKNVWTNRQEKIDGLDNDNNGFIDDIHGWNFVGLSDGTTANNIGTVGDREWFRLKDKYADIQFDGKEYFTFIDGKRTKVTTPIDHNEYLYFRNLNYESEVASTYSGHMLSFYLKDVVKSLFAEMRVQYPDKKSFTYEDLTKLPDIQKRIRRDSLLAIGYTVIGIQAQSIRNYSKGEGDYMLSVEKLHEDGVQIQRSLDAYKIALEKYPSDIKDKLVGNNTLLTELSSVGTMAATIIAGPRGVEGRNNPICQNAEIMPLVVSGKLGEPYTEDVASAIRYAVDNGADVICFTIPTTFYAKNKLHLIEDALIYAETKGSLVVINISEFSQDVDETIYYPNRFITNGKELTNVMLVSSSNSKGNPTVKSNFGAKYVDLFAPGENILAGYTGDIYKVGSNSVLSMAVTAGVAALIKSYYPKLSGSQIRTLINDNVTSREGIEVEKMINKNGEMMHDAYLFDELCLSKGLINAYKAIIEAAKIK